MENEKEWTTMELAQHAGVVQAYIRQLLIAGEKLKGHKRGRDWFIPDSEAQRWLRSRKDRYIKRKKR